MLSYKRSERIREMMIQEIADIIRTELKDPRIGFVTVMDVDVTDNLRHANVYVSPMGTEEQKQLTIKGVSSAAPFIRRLLGQRMKIKFVPELSLKWDHSQDYSDKINRVLHAIKDEKKEPPPSDEGE
ncbi:MAG: 30S ribosome-binding factor RbfA [Nitrospinae bacterium]|nr:30S ribosome-binding factor RbfA [Nitrospinota bacterium]